MGSPFEVKIYREIARFIPGDIIHHICEATEDKGIRNIVNRKHRKNLNILSMMGVCRSWNDRIGELSGLFTDIAFDTSDRITISTAARFLETVETQSNNLRIYARCLVWGSDQATSEAFLSRLRLQSWRFVYFEAEHMTAPFVAYFNLPVPRLLRLSHAAVLSERLFSSSFTNLRVLDASVKKHFPWPTATLSNLVTLRLENFNSTRTFCAVSLFDLIGRAYKLEELQMTDFLRFSGGSKAKPVVRASLKSAHFIQCNLKFILQHFRFPNAASLRVESYGINLDGEPALPPSKDIGHFAPLRAWPIPVLEQHSVTGITIHMQDCFISNVYFTLELKCGAGRTINFTTTLRKDDDWGVYFESSINEILRRIRLGTRISLSTFRYLPLSPAAAPPGRLTLSSLDPPLLLLPQVAVLRTDYSLVRSTILRLADLDHAILPNLKCYLFDVRRQPTETDLAAPETIACLRSRFNNGLPLALQYWTLDGKQSAI